MTVPNLTQQLEVDPLQDIQYPARLFLIDPFAIPGTLQYVLGLPSVPTLQQARIYDFTVLEGDDAKAIAWYPGQCVIGKVWRVQTREQLETIRTELRKFHAVNIESVDISLDGTQLNTQEGWAFVCRGPWNFSGDEPNIDDEPNTRGS